MRKSPAVQPFTPPLVFSRSHPFYSAENANKRLLTVEPRPFGNQRQTIGCVFKQSAGVFDTIPIDKIIKSAFCLCIEKRTYICAV